MCNSRGGYRARRGSRAADGGEASHRGGEASRPLPASNDDNRPTQGPPGRSPVKTAGAELWARGSPPAWLSRRVPRYLLKQTANAASGVRGRLVGPGSSRTIHLGGAQPRGPTDSSLDRQGQRYLGKPRAGFLVAPSCRSSSPPRCCQLVQPPREGNVQSGDAPEVMSREGDVYPVVHVGPLGVVVHLSGTGASARVLGGVTGGRVRCYSERGSR